MESECKENLNLLMEEKHLKLWDCTQVCNLDYIMKISKKASSIGGLFTNIFKQTTHTITHMRFHQKSNTIIFAFSNGVLIKMDSNTHSVKFANLVKIKKNLLDYRF
jgi:hypothetical protein